MAVADPNWPLLLYGVFRAMRARRVPLGVLDYLDVIAALRQGYPWSGDPGHLAKRDDLRRLCRILWARKEAEVRLIDALFNGLPSVSERYRQELDEALGPAELETLATCDAEQEGDLPPSPGGAGAGPDARRTELEEGPKARVGFASRGHGLALPRLEQVSGLGDQTYILEPEMILSPRAFAVFWRRFRARVRAGARTELDVEGTVAERCRRGVVAEIVFRAPLVGKVPLVVLADASPSMGPWMPFLRALAESLDLSRLGSIRLLYFRNVPCNLVFESPHLTGVVEVDDLLNQSRGAPVLIVSDGGAARGHVDRPRVRATAKLLGRLAKERRRVVWLNPMPQSRWRDTSARAVTDRARGVSFLALDTAGEALMRAVDILRGTKEG